MNDSGTISSLWTAGRGGALPKERNGVEKKAEKLDGVWREGEKKLKKDGGEAETEYK